jgi:hypothetical protein
MSLKGAIVANSSISPVSGCPFMAFVGRYACGDHTEGNEKTENPGNSVADVANACVDHKAH